MALYSIDDMMMRANACNSSILHSMDRWTMRVRGRPRSTGEECGAHARPFIAHCNAHSLARFIAAPFQHTLESLSLSPSPPTLWTGGPNETTWPLAYNHVVSCPLIRVHGSAGLDGRPAFAFILGQVMALISAMLRWPYHNILL